MKPASSLVLAALILGAVAAAPPARSQETAAAGSVRVSQAWARATAPGAPTGAAYLTIENGGGAPDRLVRAASPVAERVELHTHLHEGGVMRMREIEGVDLAPGARTVLAPGGLHLMLVGLKQPLKRGASFPVTLTFTQGGSATVTVGVAGPGAGGPEGHARGDQDHQGAHHGAKPPG